MNDMAKNLILWVVIAIVLMSVFNNFTTKQSRTSTIAYSDFISQVKEGTVQSVTINGREIEGTLTSGASFSTYSPGDDGLVGDL
ncbi:MAG TPA: ATP-dependent metalloprotease, partial [Sedimenticola sp.]|nr:ATP-dependent metalloprotease [Sedimenticola sp.]